MITRGEFDDLISNHSNAAKERNKARSRARYELRRPLLKQIKAQAARIAELEAQAVELEKWHTLYNVCIYKREEERARIAELEAACEAALPIVCSRIEYPGDPCEKIADGIRAAIAKARGGGE